MRKIWDIHGGVHPPENKVQSLHSSIADVPLPTELIIPLNQHIGAPAQAMVKEGDTVLKGQVIGQAQGVFSANVHASTSGTILAIEDRVIAHPSGLTAPCVIITPDGKDTWCPLNPCKEYQQLSHHELVDKIRDAGLAGMGGAGFPTAVKLNPNALDTVDTLILNGTECEPYITADDALMRENAAGVVQGAKLLAKIVGNPKAVLIGIEDNKPQAIKALQEAATGTNVEVVPFPTKYPSGGEKQLIQILTGIEIPSGTLPAHSGVLVQNVGTAYAAWRAVRFGEPLIERVTTVVGKALGQECNVRAKIGTPIAHLLDAQGFNANNAARIIIGGPMMGFAISDTQVPVIKTTNCILAPSHQEMPPPPPSQACIRCGLCAEACPANLLPQQLYWYAKAEEYERLQNHNLMDCIECGACSFVCPSAIPLVQYYRAAKGNIRTQEADKQKADRARERFDHRKARIAKVEAEKEAKRQARKKAAEETKKKLAAKKAAEADANTGNLEPGSTQLNAVKPDVVAQAIANAKSASVSPEVQIKKLNRALSSAQSRVERVQKQLAECEDEKRDKLQASLKQAELKVDDAQNKLGAFNAEQAIQQKLEASPIEAQTKAVTTLQTRLQSAEEKLKQAQEDNALTVKALTKGVEKTREKLTQAKAELEALKGSPAAAHKTHVASEVKDAAATAIEKAKAKAAAAASQSPEEKLAAQITSLKTRISKAEKKLETAKQENSEHVATLEQSLDKLKVKLQALASQQP